MTTPSQTVGPFFTVGMPPVDGAGTVWLRGRVLDGAGEPVPDAVIEAWQADPPAFGRAATDAAGRWAVRVHQPYVDLSVFARGLLNRVVTRVYFADDEADPVLAAVDPARRATLIAAATGDGYTLDIHLQGPHETVFFAF
jgi:protocatechuate 3,4-dioxygenase alpha subunit